MVQVSILLSPALRKLLLVMCESKNTEKSVVVEAQGGPNSPNRRGETTVWQHFKRWASRHLVSTDDLIDAYTTGEKMGRKTQALRNIEEAAEYAAKADLTRQEATKKFFDNVDSIFGDQKNSPEAIKLKLAKLSENNPALKKQLDTVNEIIKMLAMNNGAGFHIVDDSRSLPGDGKQQ